MQTGSRGEEKVVYHSARISVCVCGGEGGRVQLAIKTVQSVAFTLIKTS